MASKRLLILGKVAIPRGSAASLRLMNIAKGFRANGWAVDIVTFGQKKSETLDCGDGIRLNSICPLPKGRCWPEQWALFVTPWLVAGRLKKICAQTQYDAAYVYGRAASINYPIFQELRHAGVLVVNDINEAPEHFYGAGGRLSPNYWNGWLGYHKIASSADIVAGITREICDYFSSVGAATYCIPSVENFDFAATAVGPWDKSKGPDILYVGAMFERDRPDWMLSVLGVLAEAGVSFSLNLVGSYTLRPNAEKLLSEICKRYPALSGSIIRHGRISDEKMCDLIVKSAICFVLRRDHVAERCSFPTRLVEFLKAGRCVISSQVPDVPCYLADEKHALLLGQKSLKEDAARIKSLLKDPERIAKIASQGRAQAERVFCAKYHTASLIDEIHKVVELIK